VIGYLDTSAFVPLLVREPGSAACGRFWDDADALVTSRLTYVEIDAALAQAERVGRLTAVSHAACRHHLDRLWSEIGVADVDDRVVSRAAELAREFGLRGYDAVHCASAEQVADDDLVAATGDRALLSAWSSLGVSTFDPNAPSAV